MRNAPDSILIYLCKKYNSFFKTPNPEQKEIFNALNVKKDNNLHHKLLLEYQMKKAQGLLKNFPILKVDIAQKKVLDYGCSNGGISIAMHELYPEAVYGIDINRNGILHAQEEVKNRAISNIFFIAYEGRKIPFENEFFDTIIMYDVIEHLQNPSDNLLELKRVLKKTGQIYITTFPWYHPHGVHLWNVFPAPWTHLIFPERIVTQVRCGMPKKYGDLGLNKMTVRKLHKLLEKTGFSIDFEEYKTKKFLMPFKKIPFINEFIISLVLLKISKRD